MFNAEALLTPISSERPCGEELTFSHEIDLIVEARREEDPTLDQGDWVTDVKVAAWPTVIDLCSDLIANKSKDIRFAVWLTEAGAKVHHFAGLGEGYKLMCGLVEAYWDDFYPDINESDSLDQRIGNISWILSRTIDLARNIPLTEGKSTAYSAVDFEVARKNSNAVVVDDYNTDNSQDADLLMLETVESARRQSSSAFYSTLLEDIALCQQAVEQLEKAVDDKLGLDGPSFAQCKETITFIHDMIKRSAQETGAISPAQAQDVETELEQDNTQTQDTQAAPMHAQHINNRQQAISQLRNVADFFRRTEPHSPVAYLADKAAHWGEMPLHEWLNSVIKDQGSLAHVEELLGLSGNKDEGSSE